MEKEKKSRRNFIKTSSVIAIASAVPVYTIASESENNEYANKTIPAPLKIGLMTYNLAKAWSIETIIKNCSETGFQQAELRTTHAHGVEVSLSKVQREEVKKRFKDSPLESIALAGAFQYHYNDKNELQRNIEGTKEYLQLAADVGAVGIRVFPNQLVEGVDPEKTMEQIGKALAEVGKTGYELGVEVRVCVHGNKTSVPAVIRKIIDYSGSEHVYVNWNCGMEDISEGKGFDDNFNLLKDRIRGVHIHELWQAGYPYRRFFEKLTGIGYKGFCNAEIGESPEPVRLMNYYRGLFLAYQNVI